MADDPPPEATFHDATGRLGSASLHPSQWGPIARIRREMSGLPPVPTPEDLRATAEHVLRGDTSGPVLARDVLAYVESVVATPEEMRSDGLLPLDEVVEVLRTGQPEHLRPLLDQALPRLDQGDQEALRAMADPHEQDPAVGQTLATGHGDRRQVIDRVLDEELPRYRDALERLGNDDPVTVVPAEFFDELVDSLDEPPVPNEPTQRAARRARDGLINAEPVPDWETAREVVDEMIAEVGGLGEADRAWAANQIREQGVSDEEALDILRRAAASPTVHRTFRRRTDEQLDQSARQRLAGLTVDVARAHLEEVLLRGYVDGEGRYRLIERLKAWLYIPAVTAPDGTALPGTYEVIREMHAAGYITPSEMEHLTEASVEPDPLTCGPDEDPILVQQRDYEERRAARRAALAEALREADDPE